MGDGIMRVKSRSIFHTSPTPGAIAYGNSFYTRSRGTEKMRVLSMERRSDTLDSIRRSFSRDNGETWSEPEEVKFITKTPRGTRRQYPLPGFVDARRDRLVTVVLDGTLPKDDPLEGMEQWMLRYRVSTDGGRTSMVDEQIMQKGPYTPEHPCEGVWVGRNSIMVGDISCRPITTRQGRLLVPVQITPLGPDGRYYNPGGGYTYHCAAVLIGTWAAGGRIDWDLSEPVRNDPSRSTRGALEPTLAEMPDGRILMVMRGSNDARSELPGYKWHSVSEDGGFTWGPIKPWIYTDGSSFHSPSSCSQLLIHSSGRFLWLGNVTATNPRGNLPRHPLVGGEVDPESLLLAKETVAVIDDRQAGEHEDMCLSNFMAHEDRTTGEVILHMTRMFTRGMKEWGGDAFVYRLEVGG